MTKEEKSDYNKQYREKNKDRLKERYQEIYTPAYRHERYIKNIDHEKAMMKKWIESHPDYNRVWRENHPERKRKSKANPNSRKYTDLSNLTPEEKKERSRAYHLNYYYEHKPQNEKPDILGKPKKIRRTKLQMSIEGKRNNVARAGTKKLENMLRKINGY